MLERLSVSRTAAHRDVQRASVLLLASEGAAVTGIAARPAPASITFTPVTEIASPINGALYKPGQVVDAKWSCQSSATATCSGTVASGQPVNSSAGKHTYTIEVTITGDETVVCTVTYTAKKWGANEREAPQRGWQRTRLRAGPCGSPHAATASRRAAGRP